MIPVSHALKRLLYETRCHFHCLGTEKININNDDTDNSHIVGRLCAERVVVPSPGYPPYRASIMDGYAIVLPSAVVGGDNDENKIGDNLGSFRIKGHIHAGDFSPIMNPNKSSIETDQEKAMHMNTKMNNGENEEFGDDTTSTLYITTGAMVPEPYNAIIPIEAVSKDESNADSMYIKNYEQVLKSLPKHKWIRSVGCDLPCGTVLVESGETLTHIHVALLTQINSIKQIQVRNKLRVGLLSTGKELITKQIPDANKIMLKTWFQQYYNSNALQVVDHGTISDDEEGSKTLSNIIFENDNQYEMHILITTGGVSMGDTDVVKSVINANPSLCKVHWNQLFMKPGKPTTFATAKKRQGNCNSNNSKSILFFGLAGNPVSAMVCTLLFVQPCLEYLMSQTSQPLVMAERMMSLGQLKNVPLDPQRPEYHRVSIEYNTSKNLDEVVISTGVQRSSRLQSMCHADGLMVLPKGNSQNQNIAQPGQSFPVILLSETNRRIPFIKSQHFQGAPLTYTVINIVNDNSTKQPSDITPTKSNSHTTPSGAYLLRNFTVILDNCFESNLQKILQLHSENFHHITDLIWICCDDNISFLDGLEITNILRNYISKPSQSLAHQFRSFQKGKNILFSPMVGLLSIISHCNCLLALTSSLDIFPPPSMISLFKHILKISSSIPPTSV